MKTAAKQERLSRARSRGEGAFTMVEIAICIAIVAFALVAIIGVMPTGLQAQKENREDTLVNQDGQLWVDAIRAGAQGLDYLTNHVDVILRVRESAAGARTNAFTYGAGFRSGRDIVGLLTVPMFVNGPGETNYALAFVRSIAGTAADLEGGTNAMGFTYRLKVVLAPMLTAAATQTNFQEAALSPEWRLARSNNFVRARQTEANFHELRVALQWPVYTMGGRLHVGRNRRVFRTLCPGMVVATNGTAAAELYFIRPLQFMANR
ncbi:MAG: hypothetical protein J7M29_04630 [Verrucomicrobia bacterium]|nr:hypothetical protein [Verrucomicrobiota bacterium]